MIALKEVSKDQILWWISFKWWAFHRKQICLWALAASGPPTFCVPFFFFWLVTTEVGHVGGLPPTGMEYKCLKKFEVRKKCVPPPLTSSMGGGYFQSPLDDTQMPTCSILLTYILYITTPPPPPPSVWVNFKPHGINSEMFWLLYIQSCIGLIYSHCQKCQRQLQVHHVHVCAVYSWPYLFLLLKLQCPLFKLPIVLCRFRE